MSPDSSQYSIACAVINEGQYIALATAGSDGTPWCSPLFYAVAQDLTFVFISSTQSRHATNIRSTGQASWAVFRGHKPPEETDGVMFGGAGRELADVDEASRWANLLYDQRFPDPAERAQHPADIAEFEATGRRIYILTPSEAHKVNLDDPHGVTRISLDLRELGGSGIQHPVAQR